MKLKLKNLNEKVKQMKDKQQQLRPGEESLKNGELVYILSRNYTDVTRSIKGMVVECLGRPVYYTSLEYRVVAENGKEYYLLYPNSCAPLYMLTGPEYMNILNSAKSKLDAKIDKLNEKKLFLEYIIQGINTSMHENAQTNCDNNTGPNKRH